MPNRLIKASVGDYYVITDDNGEYELRLPEGNFTVSQPSNDATNTMQICSNIDSIYNLSVSENIVLQDVNFIKPLAQECGITTSLLLTYGNPCPFNTVNVCILVNNTGSAISDFTVSITDNFGYISLPSIDNLCTIGSSLPPGICTYCFDVIIPDDTYSGQNLNITFAYSGNCNGEPINGSNILTAPIDCSFDPNDKTLLGPLSCGENNYVEKNEEFIYKLRFQNIGTIPATNILVSDKLDTNFDLSSFKILDVRHCN